MAYEGVQTCIPGLEANTDLSTKQFYAMKMTTANKRVGVCSTDGEVVLGVLQNKPSAAGDPAVVCAMGVTQIVAAETLVAGDFWGTDNAGKAKKVERTKTGADIGDYVAGQVVEGGATDEIVTVTVGFPTFQVEVS